MFSSNRKATTIFGASFVLLLLTAALIVPPSFAPINTLASPAGSMDSAASTSLGTAITYQGQLTDSGELANGTYDFQFILYDAVLGGSQVGSIVTINDLPVTDGMFTAALDFGAVFDGMAVWLEIGVRDGNSTGSYTTLSPRQPLTAAPYALGLMPGANITGTLTTGALNLGNASGDGLVITHAGDDGIRICSTGNNTGCRIPPGLNFSNGIEIIDPEVYGVYVDSPGADGFYVDSAGDDGVYVFSAGGDGVEVFSAGHDGVEVFSAGDDGIDAAGSNLGGYFDGGIQVVNGGCTGCLLATFAVNTGSETLQPGDLVTIQGTRPSGVDSVPMLMEVTKASEGQAVVGVVQGWAELVTEEDPRPNEIGLRLVPREGAAEPGAYVTIVFSGPIQVKANALDGTITPGTRLTMGVEGQVRALQTREVEGMVVTEGAPTIGIALSKPDENGLVWVLVDLQ